MVDTAACVADVLYRLGFQNSTDIAAAASWLTTDELYSYADEAAQRLAYVSCVFVGFDDSVAILAAAASGLYPMPAAHVYTLAAWLGGKSLRITPVRELWALDSTWAATTGDRGPDGLQRLSLDAGAVGSATVYPIPATAGTLAQLCVLAPAAITASSSTVALPTVLQDYLSYCMLGAARLKESDAMMMEMGDHFAERAMLYEQVIRHLYGAGQ